MISLKTLRSIPRDENDKPTPNTMTKAEDGNWLYVDAYHRVWVLELSGREDNPFKTIEWIGPF